ncbi:Multicopper oxidase [Corynebacterium appendicis CIP 107643]|uniref:Multicopper oxidase n=1 Tax=Corynebacterium appendicis CIP 107643 TaxID=1161099 RepID=A0A1N7KDF2_9CORY|nr:multicopper oxidase domain-containing protein [Corynebacterium appendicis]WJY60867.1 Phenoxazinone synthase [Corynebacterium appendicis CIP 107643]SIS59474.1 Multicopper oxidase [Corynebacterium appendicis CIP 107643]
MKRRRCLSSLAVTFRCESPTWQDVVNIPAFGRVTIRVAFDDIVGRTVYHCHILDHEDLGMMGTILAR